VDQSHKETNMY